MGETPAKIITKPISAPAHAPPDSILHEKYYNGFTIDTFHLNALCIE